MSLLASTLVTGVGTNNCLINKYAPKHLLSLQLYFGRRMWFMTLIKLYRKMSFYNDVLLYVHIYMGSLLKILNSCILLQFNQRLCSYYAICQAGRVFQRGIEGSFIPFLPSHHFQQHGKHCAYVLDLLGFGEIRGRTGREIFRTQILLGFGSALYNIFFSLPE